MSDEFSDRLFKRLEDLRGRVDEAKLDTIEKRLDEADRSVAYHAQQAGEAHSPDIKIANLEMVEKRRREIIEIASEVDELEHRAEMSEPTSASGEPSAGTSSGVGSRSGMNGEL